MPLVKVKKGQKVTLLHIISGVKLQSRLFSLGLIPGVEIEVLQDSVCGPFLVSVKGSQIMLGNEIVRSIMVA